MAKKQKQQEEDLQDQFREYREEDVSILKKKSIKEINRTIRNRCIKYRPFRDNF